MNLESGLTMDFDLRRRMLDYYNERAPEYEEAYTLGTGTDAVSGSFNIAKRGG